MFCLLFVSVFAIENATAQDRDRVINEIEKKQETITTEQPEEIRPTVHIARTPDTRSSGLTNQIVVVPKKEQSLVRKTASVETTRADRSSASNRYSAVRKSMMMQSIRTKLGIRYIYGTQGPSSYDCSGFIWKVFQEAGIEFDRSSARNYWQTFEPVYGQDRFEFGTLVFLNRLGHIGIVADENGFYHASTSQGVTYSTFDGYWSNRIVGFRRVPLNQFVPQVASDQ